MEGETKKRASWEWLVLVVVVVVGIALTGYAFQGQRKAKLQKNLQSDLQSLRGAIVLYKSINKANPTTLQQLLNGTYKMPGDTTSRKFVTNTFKQESGKVLDPFGKPYKYESTKGWVCSTTAGHELW